MQSPDVIASLDEAVENAREERDRLMADAKAKEEEVARLESLQVVTDEYGRPVDDNGQPVVDGGIPLLKKVGTRDQILNAHGYWQKALKVAKEAESKYKALREALAEAEKPALIPVEVLERELRALVAQDSELYEQLEDRIRALRSAMVDWNAHIDAKIAIRKQLSPSERQEVDEGALGKADRRWVPWITADFPNDMALRRQFGLMANGQGYLNPLPNRFLQSFQQAETASKIAEPTPKEGYRRQVQPT